MRGQTWTRQRMADATSRKGGLLVADRKVEGSNHVLAEIFSLEISVEVFLFKLSNLYLNIDSLESIYPSIIFTDLPNFK